MELSFLEICGALAATLILGVLITCAVQKCLSKHSDGNENKGKICIQWRKNVLVLLGLAYGSLVFLFVLMIFDGETTAKQAYELIGVPLVALVGGTLAIAKDLI